MTATSTRRPTQDQILEWMTSLSNWGRWGGDDQRGTLNLITPEKTKRALGLVQEGVSVSCARNVTFEAAADTPIPPTHTATLKLLLWSPGLSTCANTNV